MAKIAVKELKKTEKESSIEKWKGSLWALTSRAVPGRGSEEEVKAGIMALGVFLPDCLLLVQWKVSVGRARRSWRGRFWDLMSPWEGSFTRISS